MLLVAYPIIDDNNKDNTDIAIPKNTIMEDTLKSYDKFFKNEIDTIKKVFEKYNIKTYIFKRLYTKLLI